MGLRELFARRRSEQRIKRRGQKLFEEQEKDNRLKQSLVRIGERGIRVGQRLYAETQLRKGRGKEVLKQQAKKLIGATKSSLGAEARVLLRGPPEKRNVKRHNPNKRKRRRK